MSGESTADQIAGFGKEIARLRQSKSEAERSKKAAETELLSLASDDFMTKKRLNEEIQTWAGVIVNCDRDITAKEIALKRLTG